MTIVRKTIVRCTRTRYDTPLFSYDVQGIFVKCKDCREKDVRTGENRRGAQHLITWGMLVKLMLQTVVDTSDFSFGYGGADVSNPNGRGSRGGAGWNHSPDEGKLDDDERGERQRNTGGRVDEPELPVSSVSATGTIDRA